VKRANQSDPGVFTAEIGFEETKAYVQKVMANYRAYQELYNANLIRK
jgi:soluble lytic murein transglycosylase-like protein